MSVSFEDYVAFVESVSDYEPARRHESGRCGLLCELGELLAIFDERRIKRKGFPSHAAIMSELGDVLWYEVWRSARTSSVAWDWRSESQVGLPILSRPAADLAARGATSEVMRQVAVSPYQSSQAVSSFLRGFGYTIEQIAEANMLKLTGRQAAGTLHDREARVGDGGAA